MWTILIDGVDKTEAIVSKTIVIKKDGAVEDCTLTVLDWDLSAAAYRPQKGHRLRLSWSGRLEFGGEIDYVRDERLDGNDGGATITKIRARGWEFQARQGNFDITFPATPLYELAYGLFVTYLQPKGWTWIGPTTGGPEVAARAYEKTTVAAIYEDIRKDHGYPWRVNGDQQCAVNAPGEIPTPVPLTVDNDTILLGMTTESDLVRRINVGFLQTVAPKAGPGPLAHNENHVADGTKSVFLVNVEPGPKRGAINAAAGVGAGATAMALEGLYPSATLLAGDTFTVDGQTTTYTVTADATADGNGAYPSVAFTPGLEADVTDNTAVVFAPKTYVRLKVNGVDTPLNGSPWDWDPDQYAITKSGGLPTAGTVVRYEALVMHPCWVRSWAPDALQASGAWDYGTFVSDILTSEQSDLATAKQWIDREITRRGDLTRIKLRTFEGGFYPWQLGPVSHPARLVSGDWYVVSTQLRDLGRQDEVPLTDVELVQGTGDVRFYYEYHRERSGSGGGGSSSGGGATAPPTGVGGGGGLPIGHTIHLGGSNTQVLQATTTYQDIAEAIPQNWGGPGFEGTWQILVPAYILDPDGATGTLRVQLLDQSGPTMLTEVDTTTVAAAVDASHFDYPVATLVAPTTLRPILPQVRVLSGTRDVVVGHITLKKVA
ncbi:hypothetical protein [Luteitalea sp.]